MLNFMTQKNRRGRIARHGASALLLATATFFGTPVLADEPPAGWHVSNLDLVGFTGLGGHPRAFQLASKRATNDHGYLDAGHSFDQGWSIIDVTDPAKPRYVKFIPYQTAAKEVLTAQVTLHDNLMITAIDKDSKTDPAILLWDITDPE